MTKHYVITLIGPSGQGKLTAETVEYVADIANKAGWQTGKADWLGEGEACDLPLEVGTAIEPDASWARREASQLDSVDVVVQLADSHRKKHLLLCDMDSTMIEQECIDELADEAGVGPHMRDITARAMNGELDFEGALTERVALLKGLPETVIAEVLASRITYMPGGRELLSTMKAHGAHAALVSGGFTNFTAKVAEELGFHENRANTLLIENGTLTGHVAQPILGRDAKVQALHDITGRLGITPADVIAVGDGANDLGMLELAGTGVALHAKPSVAAQCDVRINHGDLTALLFLQGYARSDFA